MNEIKKYNMGFTPIWDLEWLNLIKFANRHDLYLLLNQKEKFRLILFFMKRSY
jgi:hypothetical protein